MSNNADENQKFGEKVSFQQFFYVYYLISIYFFIHCLVKPPLIILLAPHTGMSRNANLTLATPY